MSEPAPTYTDHELLLLLWRDISTLKTSVTDSHKEMREQLAKGNARFEEIALANQARDQRLATMADLSQKAVAAAARAMEQVSALNEWKRDVDELLYGSSAKGSTSSGLVHRVEASEQSATDWRRWNRIGATLGGTALAILTALAIAWATHILIP